MSMGLARTQGFVRRGFFSMGREVLVKVDLLLSNMEQSPRRLLVALLHGVRVGCLVVLPVLLAELLWVGVLHQGVGSTVPSLVRADSLAALEGYLNTDQISLIEQSFSAPDALGVRRFVGVPSQLRITSALSRALASASSDAAGLPALSAFFTYEQGISLVQREYALLGLDLQAVQRSYVLRCLGDMAQCCLLLALVCYAQQRVKIANAHGAASQPLMRVNAN